VSVSSLTNIQSEGIIMKNVPAKKIVLIDMDSVQCMYTRELLKRAHQRFGLPLYDEQDITVFDTEKIFPESFWKQVDLLADEPDFFESLEPYDYIVEAMQEMEQDKNLRVFICTSPKKSYAHCVPGKYTWVEKHHGKRWTERIIMTRDKTLVTGDVLIDDKPHIVGVNKNPTWKHVYYNQPYNRDIDKPRITNWREWKEVLYPLLDLS
jgi:5'-nucleotidase